MFILLILKQEAWTKFNAEELR